MLFKISVNNIRKSIRDYAIYFFTLVIGVAIFYVFNSMETQTAFLSVSSDTREMIKMIMTMLSGVSVFVSIVLGLLIVYASRFLMKRRGREFSVYLMLGMGKGKISVILFFETLLIGIISLAAGLLLGVCISQFTSTLTAKLFEADMTAYRFTVSGDAILKTIIYFGIMYIAVMFFNVFMVGKCRLIDLMQSGRKSESVKLKNPVLCVIIFIISAAALAYAYYSVTTGARTLSESKMLGMIATGAVSTFLIFWSVSGMLLRVVMSMKKVYFRSLNSFTFRQLSSKVNTMVVSMSLICLMLFVTICTLTTAFSLRNALNRNIRELCPADFETTLILNDEEELINDFFEKEIASEFSDYVTIKQHGDNDLTLDSILSDKIEEIKKDYPYWSTEANYPVFSISEYNALMEVYDRDKIELADGEYALVANYEKIMPIYDDLLKNGRTIRFAGMELKNGYNKCLKGSVDLSNTAMNDGIIVVPDKAVENAKASNISLIGNYKAESKAEKTETEEMLIDKIEHKGDYGITGDGMYTSRIILTDDTIGVGAMGIFIGLYVGLVFLISSGVILALRALSDVSDSIERYAMLRKIGADENDISKSIFRQTGLFFGIPLLLAIIHSIFGMSFASDYVLQIFGREGMAASIIGTSIILALIYGGYFMITYLYSKSMIKKAL
ncbi:MAG: ABC transporter permease [Ruminococcus sp.]|nr:ABC transporter permease [Ruminococcus sp.]